MSRGENLCDTVVAFVINFLPSKCFHHDVGPFMLDFGQVFVAKQFATSDHESHHHCASDVVGDAPGEERRR